MMFLNNFFAAFLHQVIKELFLNSLNFKSFYSCRNGSTVASVRGTANSTDPAASTADVSSVPLDSSNFTSPTTGERDVCQLSCLLNYASILLLNYQTSFFKFLYLKFVMMVFFSYKVSKHQLYDYSKTGQSVACNTRD